MHFIYILFLSLLSFIFLSGFLFEERGDPSEENVAPSTHIPTKINLEESSENFPLLKIKAYKRIPEDTKKESTVPVKSENKSERDDNTDNTNISKASKKPVIKPVIKPVKEKPKASRLGNKKEEISNIIKQVRPTKEKEKYVRQKRRQTGHVQKLIFNKKTSFSDIPLPLPSLSSLKLKSLMQSLPIPPLFNIPIIDSLLPSPSKRAHNRIRNINSNYSHVQDKQNTIHTNLDMANIRIGKSDDYTSLIFDSFNWDGYNTEATVEAAESGGYNFSYEPKKNRIVGLLLGYSAFSALLGDQSELFKGNDLIKNIYIDRYIGKDSIQFIIQLKKKVQMTVLDMKNPARIIVNLYPQ